MPNTPRFPLGQVVTTPGAKDALIAIGKDPTELLDRHASGDWGDLSPDDKAANDVALVDGSRILSAYNVTPDLTVWIITEADRSSTCFLLPEEY